MAGLLLGVMPSETLPIAGGLSKSGHLALWESQAVPRLTLPLGFSRICSEIGESFSTDDIRRAAAPTPAALGGTAHLLASELVEVGSASEPSCTVPH
jgi:hypothetical protein